MRYLPLCDSVKRGRICPDDLCRGLDITLCGVDSDELERLYSDEEDWYHQEDDEEQAGE